MAKKADVLAWLKSTREVCEATKGLAAQMGMDKSDPVSFADYDVRLDVIDTADRMLAAAPDDPA